MMISFIAAQLLPQFPIALQIESEIRNGEESLSTIYSHCKAVYQNYQSSCTTHTKQ